MNRLVLACGSLLLATPALASPIQCGTIDWPECTPGDSYYWDPYNLPVWQIDWSALRCAIPSGETRPQFVWWSGGSALFRQSLIGPASWAGRLLTEHFLSIEDTCWWPGSRYQRVTSKPDLTIRLASATYGDLLGFPDQRLVDYYRIAGRAPCAITLMQAMQINCGVSRVTYAINTLIEQIDRGNTIRMSRAGIWSPPRVYGSPAPTSWAPLEEITP